jgi:hypothetical protein
MSRLMDDDVHRRVGGVGLTIYKLKIVACEMPETCDADQGNVLLPIPWREKGVFGGIHETGRLFFAPCRLLLR